MNEDAQEHKNLILQEFGVASQWNSKTETSETNNNAVLLLLLVWVVRFVLGPYLHPKSRLQYSSTIVLSSVHDTD